MTTDKTDSGSSAFNPRQWSIHSLKFRSLVLIFFIGVACGLCLLSEDPNTPTQAGVIMDLPDFTDDYFGEPVEVSTAELRMLPGDTEFERMMYYTTQGDKIMCSIVLAGGEKRSIHRPEVCLPAQGWTQKSREIIPVTLNDGRVIDVALLRVVRPLELATGDKIAIPSLYMYFFVGKNSLTASHFERVFMTSWDRIVRSLNHRWAYVSISSTVSEVYQKYSGKNEAETLEMLKKFIAEIAPRVLVSENAEPSPSASRLTTPVKDLKPET
jgi:hypothetical protein